MPKTFSILICGKIRDSEAFGRDVSIYSDWQAQGVIKDIVFSGWREDRNDRCIGRLVDLGARIILTDPPAFRSNSNILHQMKSLHYALKDCAPDEIVLKSRTDKVWLNFSPAEALERFLEGPAVGPASPFSHRLVVNAMLPLQPFFINDMTFMGLARDVRKLVSFDIWYEIEQAFLNPEQIFHYTPHRQPDDIWRGFFRINPGLSHGNTEKGRRMQQILLKNEVVLRAIAKYLIAFQDGYRIGFNDPGAFIQPPITTLCDLLSLPATYDNKALRFDEGPNTLLALHDDAIPYLLDLPISLTDRRTLRLIADSDPLSESELQAYSEMLRDEIERTFPDHHLMPRLFQKDGPVESLASRVRFLFPN